MGKYPILMKLIMKLHHDFKVELKVWKEDEIFPYGCGIRQGDNPAWMICIMTMQVTAIEIEKQYWENDIAIPQMYKTKNKKIGKTQSQGQKI